MKKSFLRFALVIIALGIFVSFSIYKMNDSKPAKIEDAYQADVYNTNVLYGIDVSKWNTVDLASVPYDFVIIKATGGTGYVSDTFYSQIEQALALGKKVGVYHYAREEGYEGTPSQEAWHFYNTIAPYLGRVALFLDYEVYPEEGDWWSGTFMDTLYSISGVIPSLYSYQWMVQNFDWSYCSANYPLWLANYDTTEHYYGHQDASYLYLPYDYYGGWSYPMMRQYGIGYLDSYSGPVDLNIFYGNGYDWDRLCHSYYY